MTAIQKTTSRLQLKDLRVGKWFSYCNTLYLVTQIKQSEGFSGQKLTQIVCQMYNERGMSGTYLAQDYLAQDYWDFRDVDVKLVWAERFSVPELPMFQKPDPDLDLLKAKND